MSTNGHDRVWRGMQAASEQFDIKLPTGLAVVLHGDMPRGCGLGSNTAEFAAGVGAAVRHANERPSADELLNLIVELGGDPGHGAAALRGGLVIAVPVHGPTEARKFRVVPAPLDDDWRFVVVAPVCRSAPPTSTVSSHRRRRSRLRSARLVRLAGLLHALETGDADLLGRCVIDEVHVPFRQTLANGMCEAMAAGRGGRGRRRHDLRSRSSASRVGTRR